MLATTVDQIAELKAILDEHEAMKNSITERHTKFVNNIKQMGEIDVELVKHHGAAFQEKLGEIQLKVDEAKAKLPSVKTSDDLSDLIQAISREVIEFFK